MIFFIITLDRQGDFRNFLFNHHELEAGLDVLNMIVASGDVLVKAVLIDNDSVISLPVEAFEGEPCRLAIKALERDWRQLLNNPINK